MGPGPPAWDAAEPDPSWGRWADAAREPARAAVPKAAADPCRDRDRARRVVPVRGVRAHRLAGRPVREAVRVDQPERVRPGDPGPGRPGSRRAADAVPGRPRPDVR